MLGSLHGRGPGTLPPAAGGPPQRPSAQLTNQIANRHEIAANIAFDQHPFIPLYSCLYNRDHCYDQFVNQQLKLIAQATDVDRKNTSTPAFLRAIAQNRTQNRRRHGSRPSRTP